ncbi:MAG: dephospho-CoA kinase, partial [Candidatus Omnitrophica bacterium]|nr:dephospho-CoA kinase [Candidatus Omnitrophota bacterium]
MSVIGLTGCFSCGKSSVLRMLKNKGAYVFDCDEFIHACYKNKESPVYRKVAKEFPDVLERGRINRRKLGRLAFSDRRKLKALEAIVHPQAIKGLLSWVKKARKNKVLCVGEVPLLFEKKLDRYFDKIILVAVKRSVQIKRIREKYNFSRAE